MDIRQVYSPSGAVRVEQRFPRFAGFRIAKQPTFPRNKFGMPETSCWVGLFSKFVKFHLVKTGNRQGITHRHNVVQGANLSLIKRSKMRQKESTARMRRRYSALSAEYYNWNYWSIWCAPLKFSPSKQRKDSAAIMRKQFYRVKQLADQRVGRYEGLLHVRMES